MGAKLVFSGDQEKNSRFVQGMYPNGQH